MRNSTPSPWFISLAVAETAPVTRPDKRIRLRTSSKSERPSNRISSIHAGCTIEKRFAPSRVEERICRSGLPNGDASATGKCDHPQMAADSEGGALAAGWWERHRLARGGREERKALASGEPADAQAAWDFVARSVEAGGAEAVALLVALNDAGPPDDDRVTVGSGPLEELITAHGQDLIGKIEDLARLPASFARPVDRK